MSRRVTTGRTSTDTARDPTCRHDHRRLRQGPRPRARRAAAGRARGRLAAVLPLARGPAAARRRDGGRRADHARLQQLPRPDRRRARRRGRRATRSTRYGTGLTGSRLLNGTIPLHLELEREIAEWMGTEDAIVFTTGHQANVGTLGHDPRARRHRHRRLADHASILDGCLLVARQAAPVPPRPARQAREAAPAGGGGRRRRARRRRRRLLDGGRRRAAARDRARCAEALRRAPHGRRGARRRRARRARRRRDRAARRRGPTSTCGWARSRSRSRPAAASWPGRPTSSTSCELQSRAFLFTAVQRARRRSAPRWPRCGSSRSDEGPPLLRPRARERRATAATGCASAASRSSRARPPATS